MALPEFIKDEARSLWRLHGHPKWWVGRLLIRVFRSEPVVGLIIHRYSNFDEHPSYCSGEIIEQWFFNGESFRSEDVPEITFGRSPNKAIIPVISFYFDNVDFAVINQYFGPRYGSGAAYRLHPKGYLDIDFDTVWQS